MYKYYIYIDVYIYIHIYVYTHSLNVWNSSTLAQLQETGELW